MAYLLNTKRRKQQRNSSDYTYTTNLIYNITRGQVDTEYENEYNSSSQLPSTVPYYDYIEDGTPHPSTSGSRERILSSNYDSMEQNWAYMAHHGQVADLCNASGSGHFMEQNQAYQLQQIADSYNTSY